MKIKLKTKNVSINLIAYCGHANKAGKTKRLKYVCVCVCVRVYQLSFWMHVVWHYVANTDNRHVSVT